MSFEKNMLNFLNKRKLKEEQIELDSVFTAENGYNKILWAEVFVQVDSTEPLTKEISYSGKASFEVYYLDNENKIKVFTNSVPFLNKFINESVVPTTKVSIFAQVKSVKIDNDNEKIRAVVSFDTDIYNIEEIEVLCGADDDICIQTDDNNSMNLIKSDCITLNEDIDIEITEKMDNILSVKSCAVIKNFVLAKDYFTVEGEINSVIKYIQTTDEVEKVVTVNYTEPFKREIEVVGLEENGIVEGRICIKRDAYNYEVFSEEKKITINVPLTLCYKAFQEETMQVVSDLFSLTHNLSVVTNSFSKTEVLESEFFENKLEGSVNIEENEPRIDKIIGFSNANIDITNSFMQNGEFVIEGIVSFDVSYLNDELNSVNTTSKEIPFVLKTKLEIPENAFLFPQINLSNVEITSRRGREIFLDAKIKVLVNIATTSQGAVITNVEFNEEFPAKTHAIEIYFGQKGDDIWDIAKELRIKPEIISIQNPNIVLPLEQNENIIIYNQKTNF